VLDIK